MKIHFKDFLLNEQKEILGHKIGTILTQVQDLVDNGQNMGARLLIKRSEATVNLIRKILHQPWNADEIKYLITLQKIGVAIMRAIDQKDDLSQLLPSVSDELGKLSHKLGTPVNNLGNSQTKSPVDDTEPTPPEASTQNASNNQEAPQPPPPMPPAGDQAGQMPSPAGQPGLPPNAPLPPGQPQMGM